MTFHSILFGRTRDGLGHEPPAAPDFFVDLNLDQVVSAITSPKQEYDLAPFFHAPLQDVETIQYRQEVMRDLESEVLRGHIREFAKGMRAMREDLTLADKLYYRYEKEWWFLEAARVYCEAVAVLVEHLSTVELASRGFRSLRDYITSYSSASAFRSLVDEVNAVRTGLSGVKYSLRIKDNWIKVRRYEEEADYSAEVEQTFAKFKQGAVKSYRSQFRDGLSMNHVEVGVLERVAKLHPAEFSALDNLVAQHADFLDKTIAVFDREVQFYVAYHEYMEIFEHKGLKFCYPHVSAESKEVRSDEGFDLALAYKLVRDNSPVVSNDFYLEGEERILVVSGPNQGGKTTFARTFGQLHYMASLGCPVPGRHAQLFLFDRLFTHFEKEEPPQNLHGKLQDDLLRMHDILEQATPRSLIIINEIFTSTTLKDAVFLGQHIMARLSELDALCVCVTFIVELATLNERTVSMVSTVIPENPAVRTFKIVRRPANGLSYAISIAERHGLTHDRLKERLKR